MMNLTEFLQRLQTEPTQIQFADTMRVIDAHYQFTPTAFQNGTHHNAAGQNNGSCKICAFALLHGLSLPQTLACFGDYYRVDVLQHPDATDHQNIRQLLQADLAGLQFAGQALKPLPDERTC